MREKNKSRKIKVILFACIVVIVTVSFLVISHNKKSYVEKKFNIISDLLCSFVLLTSTARQTRKDSNLCRKSITRISFEPTCRFI